MLAVAAQKNIYQSLVQSDILPYLKDQHQSFDLIIAGDVLIYFGDLETVFADIYQALRPQGLFVFNTEINNTTDYEMTESGRFAHSSAYLDKLIKDARFETLEYKKIQIRMQQDTPVQGHLYLLKKGD
jgi:predicted TPR repeat methyltransferase